MGDRIGIVGGGPAGLAAAYALGRAGREAVVFEASTRVGGKCMTRDIEGTLLELGAVTAAPGYSEVLALARELSVPLRPAPCLRLVDLDGSIDRPLHIPPASVASAAALARFVRLLHRYRRLAGPTYGELPEDLQQPIASFLERHRLAALRDALVPAYTGYGYGYESEIPAAYLLKMLFLAVPAGASGVADWVRTVRANGPGPLVRYSEGVMFEHGYRSLWTEVARHCDVRLEHRVEHIDRSGDVIRLHAGGAEHEVDQLVLAVDPRAALAALGDGAEADEAEALRAVRYLDYYVALCKFDPVPRGRALYIRDNAQPARRGRPVICAHTAPSSQLCNVYLYGHSPDEPALTEEVIGEAIATDLGRLGHRLERVVAVERWRYFPHLPPDRIAWFFDRMERRQGDRRTWYLGEAMSFCTVENVVAHARAIAARI